MILAPSTIHSEKTQTPSQNAFQRFKQRLKKRRSVNKDLLRPGNVTSRTGYSSDQGMLPYLTGMKRVSDPSVFRGNIENYIGLAQVPVGLAGPVMINGNYAHGEYKVPMATTEGVLVASYNRGAKLISLSGGASVMCLADRQGRSPGFIFDTAANSVAFVAWCQANFSKFKEIVPKITQHGYLLDLQPLIDGNYVYLSFVYETGDAAGQNMVTIVTDAVCRYILQYSPIKPRRWYIEANLSGDKKATARSFQGIRGKKVSAEVVLNKKLVQRGLHVTPEEFVEYTKMATLGAVHSGSLGINGHYANALAAIFIACGQDAACVAEGAVGTSRAELTQKGDLYVSVTLPNLVVGTVGGGTQLPTQKECLGILGCVGKYKARKFAEICAAMVLAGEISITGAIAAGEFTMAHQNYARKPKEEVRS